MEIGCSKIHWLITISPQAWPKGEAKALFPQTYLDIFLEKHGEKPKYHILDFFQY
jgi:hypothetical protein